MILAKFGNSKAQLFVHFSPKTLLLITRRRGQVMAWLSITDDNVHSHNQSGMDRSIKSLGLTTTNLHTPSAPKRQRLSFCIQITSLDIHGIFVSSLCFWIDKEICQKNQVANRSRSPQNNTCTCPNWVQLQLTRFCKSTLVTFSASSHKPEIHLCRLGISLPFLRGGKPEKITTNFLDYNTFQLIQKNLNILPCLKYWGGKMHVHKHLCRKGESE